MAESPAAAPLRELTGEDAKRVLFAVGAGLDMALMADIRFAAESARLGESYIKVGLIAGEEAVASLEIAIRCLEPRPVAVPMHQHKGPRRVVG